MVGKNLSCWVRRIFSFLISKTDAPGSGMDLLAFAGAVVFLDSETAEYRTGDRTRPFVNTVIQSKKSIYSVYRYTSLRNTYTGKLPFPHQQEQKSDPVPARWK